jgi:fimbrial isopeptide formation D2 family protein/LPXTG-motif cell wall-anchored protein
VPTDWTLSAQGPSPISGATGDASVTNTAVEVGDYDLAETGPENYTASTWTCVDAQNATVPVDGAALSLSEGQSVTCTIVNTPVPGEWAITKSSNPVSGSSVQPGDEIVYTVTLIRGAGVAPQNVALNDDLSDVLNNATLVSGPTPSTGTVSIAGTAMTWTVPLLENPIETVTYTVRVNDDAWGVTLRNAVTSPGSSPCVPADGGGGRAAAGIAPLAAVQDVPWEDGDCPTTTVHYTPKWELAKTSNPSSGSTVNPGDTITYTLTARNTSTETDLTGAVATDDLSKVLNNATLVSVGAGGTVSGTTLTWAIPDLGPGESATLTYVVRVKAGAYDVTIGNVATPGDGGTCPTACATDHITPKPPVRPIPPNPPLPQTGTNASLEGALLGLLLAAGGVGVLVAGRLRRRS